MRQGGKKCLEQKLAKNSEGNGVERVGQRGRGRVHGLSSPERWVGEEGGGREVSTIQYHAHKITQG